MLRASFSTPWCLYPSRESVPPALLAGCVGQAEAGRERGPLCLPLAPSDAGALGSLRVIGVRGPATRLLLAGPFGLGLWVRALRWLACVDPVSDASGFPYLPSFDGGLGRCTGAVSCGRRHLPLRVGGRHTRVPCVCACAGPSGPGLAGRPPGRVLVHLTFSFRRFVFLLCSAPSGLGLPPFWSLGCPLPSPCPPLFFPIPSLCSVPRAPPLSLSFFGSGPRVPSALALCFSFLPPPMLGGFFLSFVLRLRCLWLSVVSGRGGPWPWRCVLFVLLAPRSSAFCAPSPLLWFPPGRWPLPGVCCPLQPPLPRTPLLCLVVFVAFALCSFVFLFFFSLCAPVVSCFLRFPAPGALGPRLCAVYFVGLPLLGFPCASASLVFPASPLAAPCWLLHPLRCCVSRFSSLPHCPLFFFSLCAPVVSGLLWLPAPGALGLGAVCCLVCWGPASRLSVRSRLLCVSCLAVGCSLVVATPPPLCVPVFVAVARYPIFFFLLVAGSRRPSPPPRCVRRALRCPVLQRCAALPCCVPCCGASPWCVVSCSLCGVCWGVCLCVVLRCWLLLRVVPCVWLCHLAGLFAVWLAASFLSALLCAVLCCVPLERCCAALLRVLPPSVVLLCAVLFCCACLVSLLVVPCPLAMPVALGPCALRRCVFFYSCRLVRNKALGRGTTPC